MLGCPLAIPCFEKLVMLGFADMILHQIKAGLNVNAMQRPVLNITSQASWCRGAFVPYPTDQRCWSWRNSRKTAGWLPPCGLSARQGFFSACCSHSRTWRFQNSRIRFKERYFLSPLNIDEGIDVAPSVKSAVAPFAELVPTANRSACAVCTYILFLCLRKREKQIYGRTNGSVSIRKCTEHNFTCLEI